MVALQNFVVLALSTLTLAFPTPTTETSDLAKRAISGSKGATCGRNVFTASQVEAAASAAASRVAAGSQIGRNKYPHVFNNREGFVFEQNCQKPFYEFPIFRSKVYTGEDPEVDRVIIGSVNGIDAAFCGLITHTNAPRRNGFLQCESS